MRGDLQHHITDDIYAATGAYRSFHILIALVCAFELLCHQIDFKNAFINADMDDEIYTACPPGMERQERFGNCSKRCTGCVNHQSYGSMNLYHSSRVWDSIIAQMSHAYLSTTKQDSSCFSMWTIFLLLHDKNAFTTSTNSRQQ